MGASRVAMVKAAYAALKDDAKVGIKTAVKPAHLADRYSVAKHPAVVAGHLEEEETAMAFLRVWCDRATTHRTQKHTPDACIASARQLVASHQSITPALSPRARVVWLSGARARRCSSSR